MKTLFPHLPFIEDETPQSWAARLAAFHTGGRLIPFLNDQNIPVRDFARGLPSAVMRLCECAGQDPEPVLKNTISAVGPRRFQLRGQEFSVEFTTGSVTRFCPHCLLEDQVGQIHPYASMRHRLFWRFMPVRVCPIHKLPLRDWREENWSKHLHEVQALHTLLEREAVQLEADVPNAPSALQCYVVNRFEGHAGPSWLDLQNVDHAVRATEMLGGLALFGAAQKASSMTQDMWDQAGRAAWNMVADGRSEIEGFLSAELRTKSNEKGCASPCKAFGMLFDWLNHQSSEEDGGPIKELLREVIVREVPLRPGRTVLGKTVVRPYLSSVGAIASAERINPRTLRKVLQSSGLISEPADKGRAQDIVQDYMQVKDLIDDAKHAVSEQITTNELNVSGAMLSSLIELGVVTYVDDCMGNKGKFGKAIDGRSVRKILLFLRENIPVTKSLPEGSELVPEAAEKLTITMRVIFELLFGKHLKGAYRIAGRKGLGGLVVNLDEIRSLLESPPPGLSENVYFPYM